MSITWSRSSLLSFCRWERSHNVWFGQSRKLRTVVPHCAQKRNSHTTEDGGLKAPGYTCSWLSLGSRPSLHRKEPPLENQLKVPLLCRKILSVHIWAVAAYGRNASRAWCLQNTAVGICCDIFRNCSVHKLSCIPVASKNLSPSHIYEMFNSETQKHFSFAEGGWSKCSVIHIVNNDTDYFETYIELQCSAQVREVIMETLWIHKQGLQTSVSSDM